MDVRGRGRGPYRTCVNIGAGAGGLEHTVSHVVNAWQRDDLPLSSRKQRERGRGGPLFRVVLFTDSDPRFSIFGSLARHVQAPRSWTALAAHRSQTTAHRNQEPVE